MGKFHVAAHYLLGLLCVASIALSPLAYAGRVSVDVHPTTGYVVTNKSTVALPPRATTTAIQVYNPTLGFMPDGGAYQTTKSGITIDALKQGQIGSTTMSGRITATAGAMKGGIKRCFTSFRCNAALMVGSLGLEKLFDGIDWVMGEGGAIYKKTAPVPVQGQPACPAGSQCNTHLYASGVCSVSDPGCSSAVNFQNACNKSQFGPCYLYRNHPFFSVVPARNNALWPLTYTFAATGGYTYGFYINRPGAPIEGSTIPVSPSEVPPAVDQNYIPDPTDLPFLFSGGLDFAAPGVEFEILDIPSINGSENPITTENADGTTSGTFSQYDFTWTGPSKQPTVNVREQTTETTYSPTGEPIGEKKTIVLGSGSPANNPPETPTDCDFMPTVCMFLDWFTEPDAEIQQDVDFGQLIDTVDIDKTYTVGSSTAACPQPFTVNLSWVPTVEVSIQPFCDLADLLRPLLLAIASILSGMIILRT